MRGGKGLTQKTRNTQNHAELDLFHADSAEPKVAVRTCEGKAIRRDHAETNSLM